MVCSTVQTSKYGYIIIIISSSIILIIYIFYYISIFVFV